jgi:hypothetical protein
MVRYFMNTVDIANYLYKAIRDFGFYVWVNRSDCCYSDSIYLKVNIGSREKPEALHIRVSNHPVPQHKTNIRYDYDICASRARKGATTYVKFIERFAQDQGKELPRYFRFIQPGTERYRDYTIRMQKRAS